MANTTDKVFGRPWTDISSEQSRTYVWTDYKLSIDNPKELNISDSGGHRLVDEQGNSYYIPNTWKYITWKVKTGQPHFVM